MKINSLKNYVLAASLIGTAVTGGIAYDKNKKYNLINEQYTTQLNLNARTDSALMSQGRANEVYNRARVQSSIMRQDIKDSQKNMWQD